MEEPQTLRISEDSDGPTLIIGFGNLLRGDDAAGRRAANELERFFHHDPDVEVIDSHQLTLEMAENVARSQLVLFLDAAVGDKAGALRRRQVLPDPGPPSFTHHLTPSSLLAAAEQLYGHSPMAMSLTLAGWSFELGDKLSPGAVRRLPELIRLAKEIVKRHRRTTQAQSLVHTS